MPVAALERWPREEVEIAIDVLHVDGEVHQRPAAVDQHRDSRDGQVYNVLDRHDGREPSNLGDRRPVGVRGRPRLSNRRSEIALVIDVTT